MELTMALSSRDNDKLVEVQGVLDFASVAYLRRCLFDLIDQHAEQIVVDVSELRILDASTVGVLLYLQRHGRQRGAALRLAGARGCVLEVLEVAGVAKQLGAYEDIDWPQRERIPVACDDLGSRHGAWPPGLITLLVELRGLAADDPRRARLRDHIIEQALPAAQRLAKRFATSGEPPADLMQVAALALVKAVDRFDVDFGTDFGVFATPTIVGELKRHLRDRSWGVHVSRRLQELRLSVNQGREELTGILGRSPPVADLARHLGVGEDEVIEVLAVGTAYRPVSLEAPLAGTDDGILSDLVVDPVNEYTKVENSIALHDLMRQLPRREQEILGMRFYGNLTQSEIAERVGVSQMHVSRLLQRSLETLRRGLTA